MKDVTLLTLTLPIKFSQKGLEEILQKRKRAAQSIGDNPCPVISETLTNADAWSYFIERLSLKGLIKYEND
jgi:hypothetical protein